MSRVWFVQVADPTVSQESLQRTSESSLLVCVLAAISDFSFLNYTLTSAWEPNRRQQKKVGEQTERSIEKELPKDRSKRPLVASMSIPWREISIGSVERFSVVKAFPHSAQLCFQFCRRTSAKLLNRLDRSLPPRTASFDELPNDQSWHTKGQFPHSSDQGECQRRFPGNPK